MRASPVDLRSARSLDAFVQCPERVAGALLAAAVAADVRALRASRSARARKSISENMGLVG
jgi:hypothetical protein